MKLIDLHVHFTASRRLLLDLHRGRKPWPVFGLTAMAHDHDTVSRIDEAL